MISGLVERASLFLLYKIRLPMEIDTKTLTLSFPKIDEEVVDAVDFQYLLVRFGNNELLEQDPAPKDKKRMKLQNKPFSVRSRYDASENELVLEVPVRTHSVLSTEFKMYVDIEQSKYVDDVESLLESHPRCREIDVTDSPLRTRIFFLLSDFPVTESPEGFRNNVLYTPDQGTEDALFFR